MASKKPTNTLSKVPQKDGNKSTGLENFNESFRKSVPTFDHQIHGNRKIEVKPAQPITKGSLPDPDTKKK